MTAAARSPRIHAVSDLAADLQAGARRPSGARRAERARRQRSRRRAVIVADVARRILDEIEQMQVQLENQRKTVAGTLTLAAFRHGHARHRARPPCADCGPSWPGLQCRLVEADSHHAMALVEDGSVDVALVHDWLRDAAGPVRRAQCAATSATTSPTCSCTRAHPLAGRGSVAMARPQRRGAGSTSPVRWPMTCSSGPSPPCRTRGCFEPCRRGVRQPDRDGRRRHWGSRWCRGWAAAAVPATPSGCWPSSPTPTRQVYAVWRLEWASAGPALRAAVLALRGSPSLDTVGRDRRPAGSARPKRYGVGPRRPRTRSLPTAARRRSAARSRSSRRWRTGTRTPGRSLDGWHHADPHFLRVMRRGHGRVDRPARL